MSALHLHLILVPVVGTAVIQAVLCLLARGLGRRLTRPAIVVGQILPWLLLLPWLGWLGGPDLLAPTGALAGQVPGTRPLAVADRFAGLNDAVLQFLPWELEVRHRLAERRLPLWSDLVDGGSDLWANPQVGVLSPIVLVARAVPIQHHLLVALALKILVAFEGAWLLARLVGARPAAAHLAGVGFALGGGILGWALFPHSAVAAWTPWLVAGCVRLAREFGARALAATAIAAAAVLVSGQPEAALAGALLAALTGLAMRRRRATWWPPLVRLAVAAALGAGLAAAQLVPFALLLPYSQRAREQMAAPAAAPSERPSPASPRTWFAEYKGGLLAAPANPLAFGVPYRESFRGPIGWPVATTTYTGVVTFLGLAAAAGARRRRRTLPLIAAAAAMTLLAAEFLPLAAVVHRLPLLRLPEATRFLPAAALALAVAGAVGVEALLRAHGERRFFVWALAAAASLALAPRAWPALLWGLVGLVLTVPRRRPALAAIALLAVALLDLGRWGRWLLPRGDPGHFYPGTECTALLREETSGGPWRAVGQGYLAFPSILPVYGIAEVRPHNPLAPLAQIQVLDAAFGYGPDTAHYFEPFTNLGHPLLDFLNVRAVVSNRYVPAPPGMEVVPSGEPWGCRLYRNASALPRWFVPRTVEVIERRDLGAWIRALDDPARVAVFADEAGAEPAAAPAATVVAARPLALAPGRVRLVLPPGGRRLLATSVPGPRGWRATGGGERLRTLTVDGAFLGVLVPAGVGEVELGYRPPGLAAGLGLSALSVLLVAALAAASSGSGGGRARVRARVERLADAGVQGERPEREAVTAREPRLHPGVTAALEVAPPVGGRCGRRPERPARGGDARRHEDAAAAQETLAVEEEDAGRLRGR